MKKHGHEVTIFTSRYESKRAFKETNNGTLDVVCVDSPFPRHLYGKLHIFFALLRACNLAEYVANLKDSFDVAFCDQISAYVPSKCYTFCLIVLYSSLC